MRSLTTSVLSNACAAVLTATLLACPAAALETFEPSKWPETQQSFRMKDGHGGAAISGVATRGTPNNQSNELRLVNPNSINTIEVDVTLLEFRAPGGVTNEVRASIDGFFYQDNTNGGTVRATFGVGANGSGNPVAMYYVLRCTDSSCASSTALTNVPVLLPNAIQLFQTNKLKLEYTGTSFNFQVNNDPPATFTPPAVSQGAPAIASKLLRTRLDLSNNDPNAVAAVTALFENVRTNGALYADFNSKTLPRVQILPASGTFSTKQAFDGVLVIETGGEGVASVKLTANGADISNLLSSAIQGTPSGGGRTYRVPNVLAGSVLMPGAPILLGAEVVTAGGQKASGFALWNAVATTEP